mgnify:CR=1 FL=1
MAKGVTPVQAADGLTTRQRRNSPLVIVHGGAGKGKSTAAFGLALRGWNQGWSIGVFQFVKSAKWRIGEQAALAALDDVHRTTGQGGPIEWHKMGSGWSWSRKAGTEEDHAEAAREGWAEIKRRLALPQFAGRFAMVRAERSATAVTFTITDQGEGFEWQKFLTFDPDRAFDPNGRGIAMARMMSFAALEYQGRGNVVVAQVNLA